MECLRDKGRKGGVTHGFHGGGVNHYHAVLVDLLVENGEHDGTVVLLGALGIVNEEGLGHKDTLLFPSGHFLTVAVINLKDCGGSFREEELSKEMEAVLLSLEGRVDDGEVDNVSLRGDDVDVCDLLGIHVQVVASESHFGRDVLTILVPKEAEVLEVEGISAVDVGGLIGGVDVTGHVIVTSVHHEGVVAGVEFSVGSVTDFHDIEFGVLLVIQFEILFHRVSSHESGGAHGDGNLGVQEVSSGVAEGVVVPELAILVGDTADTHTLVSSALLNSVEALLLLHHNCVVHLSDEADSVTGCNILDDMGSSESSSLEVIFPFVEAVSREVVGAELQVVGRVSGHNHLSSGKFPGHDTDVITLLLGTAPVHGDAGNSIGHSLGSGVLEEHVLRLLVLLGDGVEFVVIDQLGAELEGVSVDSVAVVSEEAVHEVVQLVLTHLEERRAGVNQIADNILGDTPIKLDLNISEVLS